MTEWYKVYDHTTLELSMVQDFEAAKNNFKHIVERNRSHSIELYKGYYDTPIDKCIFLDWYNGLRDGRSTINTDEIYDVDLSYVGLEA